MTKANKKSLGAFRNHYWYQYELTQGYAKGFMGALLKQMACWGIQFEIGDPKSSPKTPTFRVFANNFLNYKRKAALEELLKLRNVKRGRWLETGNIEHERRVLIGIRLTRVRVAEEIEKGDKELARRESEKQDAEVQV